MWEVGEELGGRVVINVLVAVGFEEVVEVFHGGGEVITATEAYHFMEKVRIFEGKVSGVICAKAAAGGHDGGMGVFLLNEVQDFVQDIFFVLQVPQDTFGGMEAFGVKAFLIDALEAPDL